MQRLWAAREHRQIMRLVRTECCNYDDCYKECLLSDGYGCALETSLHPCCNYFKEAVWPLDKTIPYEMDGKEETRKCQSCGKSFLPGSNRAKYCPECAEKEAREKHAARQRKYRVHRDGLEPKGTRVYAGSQERKLESNIISR